MQKRSKRSKAQRLHSHVLVKKIRKGFKTSELASHGS